MRIYRRTAGITVSLRRATEDDLLDMELRYPDDPLLPTMSAQESWVLIVGDDRYSPPVGFIEYFARDSEVVITGLWVEPEKRRNGYGTMMLELVEATETPKFIRAIVTPHSRGFYEKRGYDLDQGFSIVTKISGYAS